VQLVEQNARRPRAGQDVEVEGLDLELRPVRPVADILDVFLDVEALVELGIEPDHAGRLAESEIGDRLRRPDEEKLGERPDVHQQRHHHQAGAVRRLGVLLRDEREDLLDHPGVARRVARAEERGDDLAEPVAGGLGHLGIAGDVGQAQLVEELHRQVRFRAEERQILAHQGAAGAQPLLPVEAAEVPHRRRLSAACRWRRAPARGGS